MPVNKDYSIVADSTGPPSPSPEITPVTKRPIRTYGRPKEIIADDLELRVSHSTIGSASRSSVYKTGPPDLNEEVAPSSDSTHSFFDTEFVSDKYDGDDLNASPKKMDFGWKKKLREMDEMSDFDVQMPVVDVSRSQELPNPYSLSPERPDNTESRGVPISPARGESNALTEDFKGTLSTTATSFIPHSAFNKSPSSSPQVGTARRRPFKRVVHDSDTEAEDLHSASSPVNTSPAFPHSIATPPTHSSPTPPTSDDDMPIQPSKSISKGKGRAAAVSHRPTVAPLCFSDDLKSGVKGILHKGRQNGKSKVKAPTKKVLAEISRDRLRIAADRQVTIPRTEVNSQKFTIQSLFATIATEQKVDIQPTVQLEPSSDPIGEFSSPVVPQRLYSATESTSVLLERQISPTRKPNAITSLNNLDLDSDKLPEVREIATGESKEQAQRREYRERIEYKKRILEQQNAKSTYDEDDEDDLQIVEMEPNQAIIKEEAERKTRKKVMSEGRKRQLSLGGIGLARQKVKETPMQLSDLKFSVGSGKMPRGKKDRGLVSQGELNKALALSVLVKNQEMTRRKEEEWIQRGGKIIEDMEGLPSSANDAWKTYAEQGLRSADQGGVDMAEEDEPSDEDYDPGLRGSASPSPSSEEDDGVDEGQAFMENPDTNEDNEIIDEREIIKRRPPRKSLAIVDSDSEAENDESASITQQAVVYSFGRPRFLASAYSTQDNNNESLAPPSIPKPSMHHRGSLSSLDEPTEDENDKENNTSLMFDRSEDKENKAVVRYSPTRRKSSFGESKTSLFDVEREIARGLSMSPGLEYQNGEMDKNENVRRPFKDLLDDDPFLSPTSKLTTSAPFTSQLQQTSPVATFPQSSLALTPLINGTENGGFSQTSEGEPNTFGGAPLQPGFSDLFESGTQKQKLTPRPAIASGLSSSFDEPEPTHDKFRKPSSSLDLTQDIALQPAFRVGDSLRRKADQIFEKEQGYLLEAATKKPQKEPELYINDHGFLTQTRPDVSSPEVYVPLSPSQVLNSTLQELPISQTTQDRRPLRTLSLSESTTFTSPDGTPLRRLQRRSSPKSPTASYAAKLVGSPSLRKGKANAFDLLTGVVKTKDQKLRQALGKSEFIEAEAQESDEDEMFGFGRGKQNDGEEEDGEELDKMLEELVDDTIMDEETIAETLIIEKFKEQAEKDDVELEKLHQAAVHGELRNRRRKHGVGMDDSDEDSDEDERNRGIRRGMHKKQKIDRDNIKALGENEETKPFFQVYEHDIIDNNNDFGYLQQSQDVIMANQEGEDEEEPRGYINVHEVKQRVREIAQQNLEEEPLESLDMHDVSWIDNDDSGEENDVRVKPIITTRTHPGTRRIGLDHVDPDASFELRKSTSIAESNQARMKSWAKVEGRSRVAGTTGRSAGGAAVTGHAKVKTGGGSLRNHATGSLASSRAEQRKPVKSAPSFLKGVEADISARFSRK